MTSTQIAAHADFPAAFDNLMDGIATLYGDDVLLIRKLMEYDRAVAFMTAVGLDAARDDSNPASWLTVARLSETLLAMKLTSPRRIADLVASMEQDGFLEVSRAPHDRRLRIMKLTPLSMTLDRGWIRTFHAPLALLEPGPRYAAALACDPAYQRAYRIAGMRTLALAHNITESNPPAELFLAQTAGIRILALLFDVARKAGGDRSPPGFYSFAAEKCAVSRVHVRNLLVKAAAFDLVRLSSPPGLYVEITPTLRKSMQRWVADCLSAVDLVCGYARELLGNEGPGLNGPLPGSHPAD